MVTIKNTVVASLALAAVASFSTLAVATEASPRVYKAGKGILMEVGTKKVAGYYVSRNGACDATFMVADLPDADGHVSPFLMRTNVIVKAGSNGRFYTPEGKQVALSCATGTKVMTVRSVEETASIAR